MDNLKILYMYQKKIQVIQNETFNNLKNLVELLLHLNEIKVIDENVFKGMDNLEILYLFSNKIRKIPNETFNNLINLI